MSLSRGAEDQIITSKLTFIHSTKFDKKKPDNQQLCPLISDEKASDKKGNVV